MENGQWKIMGSIEIIGLFKHFQTN